MSFQAMTWAVKQKVGNATGKAILLMLANYADDAGTCFPGQGKLAAECECSERTVREWLSKFEEMGIVRRDERRRTDGYRTSDAIILTMRSPASPSAEISPAAFSPENNSPENPSDLTGSSCRAITSQVNHQKSKSKASAKKRERTPFDELRRVLDDEHARAVVEHRQRLRKAMTPHAASLLAKQFEACPDPNAAADAMIENGWQGFKPAWLENHQNSHQTGRPSNGQRHTNPGKPTLREQIREGIRRANADRGVRGSVSEDGQAGGPEWPADEHSGGMAARTFSFERGEDGTYEDRQQHQPRYANARH